MLGFRIFTSLILVSLSSSSNALDCFVCCGCNGESSTACESYGSAYNSYFAKALNVRDAGKAMMCQLEPRYSKPDYPDDEKGEELSLASVTPACSQVIYYDTTFNEDLTLKMCMSLEACEAQKQLIGKSTHVYLGRDTAVYVDILSVQCCTEELCNNYSSPISVPIVNRISHDNELQPAPPKPEPYISLEPETTALPSISLSDSVRFMEHLMPVVEPTEPTHYIRQKPLSYADLVEKSIIKPHYQQNQRIKPPMVIRADNTELGPARGLFHQPHRFMIPQARIVPKSSLTYTANGNDNQQHPPGYFPELPDFAMILGITGPPPAMQAVKVIAGGADSLHRLRLFSSIVAAVCFSLICIFYRH